MEREAARPGVPLSIINEITAVIYKHVKNDIQVSSSNLENTQIIYCFCKQIHIIARTRTIVPQRPVD